MRAVIQRVQSCSVSVDNRVVSQIDCGLLILLGVGRGDDESDADALADRIAGLRIFADDDGKMNLSARQLAYPALVVSQFTLFADVYRGRRPGLTDAADPETAKLLYEYFCNELRRLEIATQTGIFQADMKVALINDGPVTICIDTKKQA